jgi:hypothetical protein
MKQVLRMVVIKKMATIHRKAARRRMMASSIGRTR